MRKKQQDVQKNFNITISRPALARWRFKYAQAWNGVHPAVRAGIPFLVYLQMSAKRKRSNKWRHLGEAAMPQNAVGFLARTLYRKTLVFPRPEFLRWRPFKSMLRACWLPWRIHRLFFNYKSRFLVHGLSAYAHQFFWRRLESFSRRQYRARQQAFRQMWRYSQALINPCLSEPLYCEFSLHSPIVYVRRLFRKYYRAIGQVYQLTQQGSFLLTYLSTPPVSRRGVFLKTFKNRDGKVRPILLPLPSRLIVHKMLQQKVRRLFSNVGVTLLTDNKQLVYRNHLLLQYRHRFHHNAVLYKNYFALRDYSLRTYKPFFILLINYQRLLASRKSSTESPRMVARFWLAYDRSVRVLFYNFFRLSIFPTYVDFSGKSMLDKASTIHQTIEKDLFAKTNALVLGFQQGVVNLKHELLKRFTRNKSTGKALGKIVDSLDIVRWRLQEEVTAEFLQLNKTRMWSSMFRFFLRKFRYRSRQASVRRLMRHRMSVSHLPFSFSERTLRMLEFYNVNVSGLCFQVQKGIEGREDVFSLDFAKRHAIAPKYYRMLLRDQPGDFSITESQFHEYCLNYWLRGLAHVKWFGLFGAFDRQVYWYRRALFVEEFLGYTRRLATDLGSDDMHFWVPLDARYSQEAYLFPYSRTFAYFLRRFRYAGRLKRRRFRWVVKRFYSIQRRGVSYASGVPREKSDYADFKSLHSYGLRLGYFWAQKLRKVELRFFGYLAWYLDNLRKDFSRDGVFRKRWRLPSMLRRRSRHLWGTTQLAWRGRCNVIRLGKALHASAVYLGELSSQWFFRFAYGHYKRRLLVARRLSYKLYYQKAQFLTTRERRLFRRYRFHAVHARLQRNNIFINTWIGHDHFRRYYKLTAGLLHEYRKQKKKKKRMLRGMI